MKRSMKLALWCAGIVFAILLITPSILSATPAEPRYLCAQCHAMDAEYHSYLNSSHAGQVTCSSCHVPHDNLVAGLTAKYTDGAKHLLATARGVNPDEIRISEHGLDVVMANCASCHRDVEHATQPDARYCITCHAEEPHG